jgi:uncharacterized protein (UPF0333 family)
MKKRSNKSAQAMLEYAVLIAAFVAAFAVMFGFLSRHIQGSWRSSADSIGGGRQYEEGVTIVN